MEDYGWIELIAVLTLPVTLVTLIISGAGRDLSNGVAIQFLALGAALPVILILALERIIEPGTIGTLLGGILGYVLSGAARAAGERDPR